MKNKKKYIIIVMVLIIFFIISLHSADTKLTYLEYTTVNENNDTFIALNSEGDELRQGFVMPYSIFDSVAIQIGTFQRDNNSTWEFELTDNEGNTIYSDTFNASRIEDNAYYRHKIDKKIKVNKGEIYYFSIKAIDVSGMSKLAFYVSNEANVENASLAHNNENINNKMCFKIYGGDRDPWWHGFFTFIFLYLLIAIFRMYYFEKSGKSIREDVYIKGMFVGGLVFLLLFTFSINGAFTDEYDNMRGGMVIANGGVLYRDYVTQHTPIVYYLCSVFATLGAGSIEQFRLSYYIFETLIWIFLYIRHHNYFGDKKMVTLPLLEVICISSVVSPAGYQILSDGFQGLMFVGLLLEFIRYYKDRELQCDRCIVISICIWGSFGSAFLSAYALIFIAIIVIILELQNLIHDRIRISDIIKRYYRFFLSMIVPLIAAVIYFKANHSLRLAFDQFYTFNREVYPKYNTSGLGGENNTTLC